MSQVMDATRQASQPSESASSSLAVVMTHIIDSHAAIVQRLAGQVAHVPPPVPAVMPASPSFQMTSSSHHHAHTSPVEKQAELGSDCDDQQHGNSNDQCFSCSGHSAGVATSIELRPFQQELVERIMQAGNAVIFLPAGRSKSKQRHLSVSILQTCDISDSTSHKGNSHTLSRLCKQPCEVCS